MNIHKSSWVIIVHLLISSWTFSFISLLVSGQDIVQQHEEQRYTYPIFHPDQQTNHQRIGNSHRLFGEIPAAEVGRIVKHYTDRIIYLSSFVAKQRKVVEDFRARQNFAVRPSSQISGVQVLSTLQTRDEVRFSTVMGSPEIEYINSPIARQVDRLFSETQHLRSRVERVGNMSQVVFKNRRAHVNGIVNFNMRPGETLNLISERVDLQSSQINYLLDDLVYRKKYAMQQIVGPVHLASRSSAHLIYTRQANGLDLLRDVIYKRSNNFVIKSPLKIRHLSVFNATTRSMSPTDDLFYIKHSKPVALSPPLAFRKLYMDNLVNLRTISNVDLRTFRSSVLTYNSHQSIPKLIRINSVRVPSIHLRRNLNGLDFNRRVVRLLRTNLPIRVRRLTVSARSLQASNLGVRNLNNRRFPDDFMLVNQTQTIPAPINFSGLKVTRSAQVKGTINGFRFPDSFVTVDGKESINSNLIFLDSVHFRRNINPRNYIGRHHIRDLIKWSSKQNSVVRNIINNPSGKVIVHGNLQINSTINGMSFDGFLNDLVHLADPNMIRVTGVKTFINPVQVSSFTAREINGIPVKNLATTSATLRSPVTFLAPLTIKDLIPRSSTKRSRVLDLINQRISLAHHGKINGDIYIENMEIDSLDVHPTKGRINNLAPRQLVFSGIHQEIQWPMTFTNVTFEKPLKSTLVSVGQKLNNKDVYRITTKSAIQIRQNRRKVQNLTFDQLILKNCSVASLQPRSRDWKVGNHLLASSLRNLLLKEGNQTISGRKRFLYPVTFASKINSRSSRGVLEGLQPSDLFRRANYTISKNVHLSSLVIQGNLQINGKLNELDFSTSFTDLRIAGNQVYSILSTQSFNVGLKAGRIQVKYINGQPFDKLWSVRNMKELNFMAPVSVRNLIVYNQIQLNGYLNQLPAQEINQIAKQLNQRSITIYGDVVFESPVNIRGNLGVSGKINNVNFGWLTRALANQSRIESIPGSKMFKSINVLGSLYVNKLNGRQLSQSLNNIVLIHPNKVLYIGSPVEFKSALTIRRDINSN